MWDQTRVFVRADLQGSSVGTVKDFFPAIYLFLTKCQLHPLSLYNCTRLRITFKKLSSIVFRVESISTPFSYVPTIVIISKTHIKKKIETFI